MLPSFTGSYGTYCQYKTPSKIELFKPKLSCIQLPSSDSAIVKLAIPLIVIIGLSSLPFAGVPLHLFSLAIAIQASSLGLTVSAAMMFLKKYVQSLEKNQELVSTYRPMVKKILKGELKIETLPVRDLQKCLEAIPKSDKEFFAEFKDLIKVERGLKAKLYLESAHSKYMIDFEATHAQSEYELSSLSNLGLKKPPQGRIGFINGMNNKYPWAFQSAMLISYLSNGYNVHLVHNATHGLVTDLEECRLGSKGVVTDPVWHLHRMWDNFFLDEKTGDEEVFLQICHSQGAIHVANALKHYPEERRKRIKVVAIAPGRYISDKLSKEAFHYISRDPIPSIDSTGQAMAQKVIYCPPTALINNHTFDIETYGDPLREHLIPFVEEKNS